MAGPKYQPNGLGPNVSVGDVFGPVAGGYGEELDRHCGTFQRHSDPEIIHRTRITIRRLLTATDALPTAPRDRAHVTLRSQLHRLQDALNSLRDIDTWLETLPDNARGLNAQDLVDLRRAVLRVRAQELSKCRQLCRSGPYRSFGPKIERWVRGGAWRSKISRMPLSAHAGRYLAGLDRKIRKQIKSMPKLDEAATHKLRIRVKRARYAAEIFAPLFQGRAARNLKRYSAAMRDLQSALGALTDLASHQRIAKDLFTRHGISRDSRLAFLAGLVIGQEARSRKKLSKAVRKARDHHRKVGRPDTWMPPDA